MLPLDALAPESVRPISRDAFWLLASEGFFDGERVELLRGWVVTTIAPSPHQGAVLSALNRLLVLRFDGRAVVRPQLPLSLLDDSVPQPDLALVQPGEAWREQHPTGALLVIEVSSSSLRKDRLIKAPLYAEAGIPEYWIVNLVDDLVEVYADPVGGHYRDLRRYGRGESVAPGAFADTPIELDAFL